MRRYDAPKDPPLPIGQTLLALAGFTLLLFGPGLVEWMMEGWL